MATVTKTYSPAGKIWVGSYTGDAAAINIELGAYPLYGKVVNQTDGIVHEYIDGIASGKAVKYIPNPTFTGSALGTHAHDIKVIGGITADEDVGILASGPTLGKLAATDRTIVGADSATKGGVVAITGGTPAGTNSAGISLLSSNGFTKYTYSGTGDVTAAGITLGTDMSVSGKSYVFEFFLM